MATRNRYAEIMAQYAQSQPFSFFGYPQAYTGGYDVAQPQAYAAPVSRYEEIMGQNFSGGGGRGEREAPSAWSQMTPAERAAYYAANPTEGKIALGMQDLLGNVSLMGQAAKYFGNDGWYDSRLEKMGVNPTISLENQNTLAGTSFQNALNALNPTGGFVSATPAQSTGTLSFAPPTESQYGAYLAQQQADAAGREYGTGAVPPTMTQNQFAAQYAAYGDRQQPAASTGGFAPYSGTLNAVRSYDAMGREISPNQAALSGASVVVSDARSAAEAQARADAAAQDARVAAFDASRESTRSGGGGGMGGDGGGGGGVATGGNNGDASGGGDRGTRGGFAYGGYVSMQHLGGPDPEGPDDGYAALKDGEFVINDKAVKKYGIELMNAINSGKISKGKLRGLLEM